ncbi:Cytochrome c oxidase assembly protein COX19 [Apiospora arundinis]
MASALGFIINAAGLFVPLGLQAKYAAETPKEATSVQIIAGKGGQSGGNVPHIALWDNDGKRIGQYHAGSKDKIGDGEVKTITVEHNENGNKQADPYYIMLSNLENDALCIAAITVANQKISGTFYGDTGYTCGQSWFLSDNAIGSNFQKPKCVWIDADHSNKINARALSFHLNDMAPSTDKMAQYHDKSETLCQSTPRFSFWGNLLPDGIIPFFKPQLEYKDDSSNGGQGADKDPAKVVDKPNQYDKGVYLHQGEKKTKRSSPQKYRRGATASANHDPSHLIVTSDKDHDVREVCSHANSYGWDIASTAQQVYCDMEHKQLYPLCAAKGPNDNCFDLQTKAIVPKGGVHARAEHAAAVPGKNYTSFAQWK